MPDTERSPSPMRRVLTPLFVTTFTVLLLAAIGLRPAIAALSSYYAKEPIDIRRPLQSFDVMALPSFRYLESEPMPDVESLGTDEWISYVFAMKDPGDLKVDPIMKLFVTYYSDPRDTIPHTPEVCYRQGGATVRRLERIDVEVPGVDPDDSTIQALLIDIEQPGVDVTILYVLYCNGEVLASRERARLEIALPGDKYTYFSKVEAIAQQTSGVEFQDTVEQCKLLLREALPVLVQEHYPPREELKRKGRGDDATTRRSGASEAGTS